MGDTMQAKAWAREVRRHERRKTNDVKDITRKRPEEGLPPAEVDLSRIPARHRAARTARGGWTAADSSDAVPNGKLLHPNERGGGAPPKSWAPRDGEDYNSNRIARGQMKDHRRFRNPSRMPVEPMCSNPVIPGETVARRQIRTRELGTMQLSEDTKGPGQGQAPEHKQLHVGLFRGHDGSKRRIMPVVGAGRRAGRRVQHSTGARLRYLLSESDLAAAPPPWA